MALLDILFGSRKNKFLKYQRKRLPGAHDFYLTRKGLGLKPDNSKYIRYLDEKYPRDIDNNLIKAGFYLINSQRIQLPIEEAIVYVKPIKENSSKTHKREFNYPSDFLSGIQLEPYFADNLKKISNSELLQKLNIGYQSYNLQRKELISSTNYSQYSLDLLNKKVVNVENCIRWIRLKSSRRN